MKHAVPEVLVALVTLVTEGGDNIKTDQNICVITLYSKRIIFYYELRKKQTSMNDEW